MSGKYPNRRLFMDQLDAQDGGLCKAWGRVSDILAVTTANRRPCTRDRTVHQIQTRKSVIPVKGKQVVVHSMWHGRRACTLKPVSTITQRTRLIIEPYVTRTLSFAFGN